MTCGTFRDLAFDFLQGTLRDGAEFESHRLSCPACASALDGIRENDRILSASRVPTAPPDLWPRIAAAIGQDRVVPFRNRRWRAWHPRGIVLRHCRVTSPAPPMRRWRRCHRGGRP